jgi:hypothetical protein
MVSTNRVAAFFTGIGAILSLLVFYTWLGTYPDPLYL